MPITQEETPTCSPVLKTAGYRERGGSAVEIKTTAGAVVYRSTAADTARPSR
jgi:hypothetical protein